MSEMLFDLLGRISLVYIGILGGFVLRKTRLSSDYWKDKITQLNIFLLFPITIFISIVSLSFHSGILIVQILLFAFLVHFVGYFWAVFANRLWLSNLSNPTKGGIAQVCMFPNAFLFPFPIILAVVGNDGLFSASLFLLVALLLRNTVGIALGRQYPSDQQDFSMKKLARQVLLFPPFLAMIVSLLFLVGFGSLDFSGIIIVDFIKNIVMFSALLMIGLTIRFPSPSEKSNFNENARINTSFDIENKFIKQATPAIARFCLSPLIGLFLVFIFNLPAFIAIPLVIQAASPPAVGNIIYSEFLGFDAATVSQSITILTMLALFILPVELILLSIFFPLV